MRMDVDDVCLSYQRLWSGFLCDFVLPGNAGLSAFCAWEPLFRSEINFQVIVWLRPASQKE